MRTTHRWSAVAVAATAVGAACIGFVPGAGAVPPIPPDSPACSNWHLNNFMLVLSLSNGQSASFDWNDKMGIFFSTKDPNATLEVPGKAKFPGSANGGIVGGNKFDFVVHWDVGGPFGGGAHEIITSHFTGTIVDSSTARGKAVDNKGASVNWTTNEPFVCTDAPAQQDAPAPQANPPKPADPPPAVNPPPAAEPAPTNAVTMNFKRSGLTNVTATFSNLSKVSGQCHYDAQDVNGILPGKTDDFAIGANRNVTRTYLAPPPLSTYHAVVSCTGTFNGQNVEFGHAEQDVSG
jgi:hypothetical protein